MMLAIAIKRYRDVAHTMIRWEYRIFDDGIGKISLSHS
jgi:hypothetical protein